MTVQTTPSKLLWSITDFMTASGLCRSTTYELIAAGELETVKIGRRRLVPVEAAQDWLQRLREQGRAA